jgi:transposase
MQAWRGERLVVACLDEAATGQASDDEHGSGRRNNDEDSPPRRRRKRGAWSSGVNRAGVTTTLHLAITAEEHVIEGVLTGGNVSDMTKAGELTAEVFGCYLVEDRGYDSDAHRRALEANHNIPVIPGRKNRNIPVVYDTAIYKLRRKIEMFFGAIKENRRVTVRYEKTDAAFLTFIALAMIKMYL